MRLSWNEIRARAAEFARERADATYEKGETQSFYNELCLLFIHPRAPNLINLRSASTMPA